jgi:hypothetical protein
MGLYGMKMSGRTRKIIKKPFARKERNQLEGIIFGGAGG